MEEVSAAAEHRDLGDMERETMMDKNHDGDEDLIKSMQSLQDTMESLVKVIERAKEEGDERFASECADIVEQLLGLQGELVLNAHKKLLASREEHTEPPDDGLD